MEDGKINIYICFDDTDNEVSIGTGTLLERFASKVESRYKVKTEVISRHQLYLHDDIPYTSHNSSMCLEVEIIEADLDEIIRYGQEYLEEHGAEGSDPGLCVVVEDERDFSRLIDYGKRAKKEIFTKKDSYKLAEELDVHLSEHGGTGGGVIGALAGVGLRMTGEDGRIKGRYFRDRVGQDMLAEDILAETDIEQIKYLGGEKIDKNLNIRIGYKMKTIWEDHQNTLLIEEIEDEETGDLIWATISREKAQEY